MTNDFIPTTPKQQSRRKPKLTINALVFIMFYFLRLSEQANKRLILREKLSNEDGIAGLSSADLWKQDVRQATSLAGCKNYAWPDTEEWLDMTPRELATYLLSQENNT